MLNISNNPSRVTKITQLSFILTTFILGYYFGQRGAGDNHDSKYSVDTESKDIQYKLSYIRQCGTSSKIDELYPPCAMGLDGMKSLDSNKISYEQGGIKFRPSLVSGSNDGMIDLIIIIPSAANNTDRRKAIRETWLNLNKVNRSEISTKHYFLIGTEDVDIYQQDELYKEQSNHKDLMIISTCSNAFSQLTKKLLTSYYWLVKTMNFQYLLKVDDDSFARIDILSRELKIIIASNKSFQQDDGVEQQWRSEARSQRMLYWGYFDGRAPVFKSGKWGEKKWFLCNNYLPYALGGGYIISSDIVKILASLSPYLQLYLNEDVSMGVWLAPFSDIERKHDRRFDTEATPRGCSNLHIISHHLTINEMYTRYDNLIRRNLYCSSQYQTRFSYEYNWNSLPSDCCRRGFKDY